MRTGKSTISAKTLTGAFALCIALLLMFGIASSSTVYWAVAASYKDQLQAESVLERIMNESGGQSRVLIAAVDGATFYRAVAGPYFTRPDAEAARDRLRGAGWSDAWLLIEQDFMPMVVDADTSADEPMPEVVTAAKSRNITVGLTWIAGSKLLVGTEGDLAIFGICPVTGDELTITADRAAELKPSGEGVAVYVSDDDEGMVMLPPVRIIAAVGAIWLMDPYRVYNGEIKVDRKQGSASLYISNVLDVEDYLLSVLPAEIGKSAPKEAYKAQAVVARTEALSSAGRHADVGWDICDSTHCQVFRGLYGQAPNKDIRIAVEETEGMVLFSAGSMVKTASFHSACGGWTESSLDIWGSKLPHLTNVGDRVNAGSMPDLRDDATLRKFIETESKSDLCYGANGYRWKTTVDINALESELARMISAGSALKDNSSQKGEGYRIAKRSARGAALEFIVPYNSAEYIIKGELNIRRLLGGSTVVKSGVFVIQPASKAGKLDLIGAGYGHGVGMCQEGAQSLAKLGRGYKDILAFYYKGSSVEGIY